MIEFIDPLNNNKLERIDNSLINKKQNKEVAIIINDIPRFVQSKDDYAKNFGWQWNKWENTRIEEKNNRKQKQEILDRTHFDKFDLKNKTILECGMGGGDDTQILLQFPFSEIHSFDISNSIERAKRQLSDKRLTISQASIYQIPYADESFDFVYCHRVIQHTPNPIQAINDICKKVKPKGILFLHSYKKSKWHSRHWKYKYRWLTKRIPISFIYHYVDKMGSLMHYIKKIMSKNWITEEISHRLIPFYYFNKSSYEKNMNDEEILELEKLVTFDALTPEYDIPLSPKDFFGAIEKNGFKIIHKFEHAATPMYCTAIKL